MIKLKITINPVFVHNTDKPTMNPVFINTSDKFNYQMMIHIVIGICVFILSFLY